MKGGPLLTLQMSPWRMTFITCLYRRLAVQCTMFFTIRQPATIAQSSLLLSPVLQDSVSPNLP